LPSHRSRRARLAAATAVLALGATPLAYAATADARPSPTTSSKPGKPVQGQQPIALDLLAINDFHGNLEKLDATKTSSGRINSTPAGGGEYLATHLDELRAAATARGAQTVTVAAGDLIGASPLLSAAFHDEPTIEFMNKIGLQVASVGNHEFDEGYRELLRMQNGGCLDDGDGANNQNSCPDPAHPFTGADFQYLSANVSYTDSGETVFPAYTIEKVGRAKVGFIGMTLEDTPNIVTKSGVEGLTFSDEVETANKLVPVLRAQGVRSIVVLLHQGGVPTDGTKYDSCAGVSGPGVDIAEQLDPAIDVVVTGHTHQAYNCVVTDPAGNPRLLTSASSYGRLVTDISLQIDPRSKDVIRPTATAKNWIVTNSDGTQPRADITALIDKYRELVAPIAGKVLGHIAPTDTVNTLSRTPDADGESPLGNLIADSQLADPSTRTSGAADPVIAFMNPGGIRADLVENDNGEVTFGAAFTVQPFNNYVVSETLTGQEVLDVLNQQWNGRNEGAKNNKILQVAGLSYSWSRSLADATDADALVAGSVKVDLDGDGTAETPIDPAASYRVVCNSFLSDGGDGFPTLGTGANKYFGGLDIDALASYLAGHDPYTPGATDRITAIG
jgi:5'-nucleotidase